MSSELHDPWSDLPGRLVVISGASGSGKSTLVHRLMARPELALEFSVSATTRPPRPGELHGRDYFFVTSDEFEKLRPSLLEQASVHGNLYGTPADPVRSAMARGICVVLEIDVQGGLQVRAKVPGALLIFVEAPSLEILEARLRARGTEDQATIERRLANARREADLAVEYQVHVTNDQIDRTVDELVSILTQRGCGKG